jgi:mannose/fructose-specific phosphotransferase system component IIA
MSDEVRPINRTGILLVSHGESGKAMLDAAERIVGGLDTRIVTVPYAEPRLTTERRLEETCSELDADEFLFLVDLEGSTPFNICCRRCGGSSVVLTGVNMPMLFKLSTVDRSHSAIEIAEELQKTGQKSIHIRPGTGTREP